MLRLLVAICHYGQKNLTYLRRIISAYQSLPFDVQIKVFSEAPKDLGKGVQVVVGLPSKHPWSLSFAHKPIFVSEAENYDLFLYSEDDILYTERNILAFLRAVPDLAPDEIPGFLLYERDPHGTVWLTSFYGHWHWKPESVKRRGAYTIAEFSNAHSASYLLTQAQLKQAIASNGFLREPHEGLYDLLCTAGTDPYTSCGFRKVICISALEDFLIHHTPDRYTHISVVTLASLQEQITTLMDIRDGGRRACALFEIAPKFWHFWWQKDFYEKARLEVLQMVPQQVRSVLSVGCGWGAIEESLEQRGANVIALPLDSVIGAVAARRGIKVVQGTWHECLASLGGQRFECVLLTDLLHLVPQPEAVLKQCAQFVGEHGSLVVTGPNFDRIPWLFKRTLGIGHFRKLRKFAESGISVCGPLTLGNSMAESGLLVSGVQWVNHEIGRRWLGGRELAFGRLSARDWILQARRAR